LRPTITIRFDSKFQIIASDGVKDTDGKAKDISHEAKTKAKDLTVKAKDTSQRPRTYSINPKVCAMATFPCGGRHVRDLVLAHQACDKNASLALLHLVRMGTN